VTTAAEAEQITWAMEILVGQIRAKEMAELAVGALWGKLGRIFNVYFEWSIQRERH
jgi:hypothetical protein